MNCEWVRQNLSAYIDHELSSQQVSDIEGHLPVCTKCSDAYKSMKLAWDALESWEDAVPPDHLKGKILGTVRFGSMRRWSMVISAAAVLLIAVSALLFYGTGGKEKHSMQMVRSENTHVFSDRDLPDAEKEEILANLDLLQDKDFYDSVEILKKIDYLPLVGEDSNEGNQKSSLEKVIA